MYSSIAYRLANKTQDSTSRYFIKLLDMWLYKSKHGSWTRPGTWWVERSEGTFILTGTFIAGPFAK